MLRELVAVSGNKEVRILNIKGSHKRIILSPMTKKKKISSFRNIIAFLLIISSNVHKIRYISHIAHPLLTAKCEDISNK